MYLTELDAAIRLVVAVLLGGIIGFERERAEKPAGIRTYALVCEGAALFMLSSLFLGDLVSRTTGDIYDPSRIASTVVQGIGFLAAGVIFASRGQIKGLTTAAGIWVTAAIGLAVGAGFYIVAGVATALALLTLYPVQILERRITDKPTSESPADGPDDADQPESPFRAGG